MVDGTLLRHGGLTKGIAYLLVGEYLVLLLLEEEAGDTLYFLLGDMVCVAAALLGMLRPGDLLILTHHYIYVVKGGEGVRCICLMSSGEAAARG